MEWCILIDKSGSVLFRTMHVGVIFNSPFDGEEYVLYWNNNASHVSQKKIKEALQQYEIYRSYSSNSPSLSILKLLRNILINFLKKELELYQENRYLYSLLEEEYKILETLWSGNNNSEEEDDESE